MGSRFLPVGRGAAALLAAVPADHCVVGQAAIAFGHGIPDRVQTYLIRAGQHFAARDPHRVFPGRIAARAAVVVARHLLGLAAVPGGAADVAGGRDVHVGIHVQVDSAVALVTDLHRLDAQHPHAIGQAAHVALAAVQVAVAARVAHKDRGPHQDVGRLSRCDQKAPHTVFGSGRLVLPTVAGAALGDARVFLVEMPQLPLIQQHDHIGIGGQGAVGSLFARLGQARIGGREDIGPLTRAAGQRPCSVQHAREGRLPRNVAAAAIRRHIGCVGRIAGLERQGPGLILVLVIRPHLAQQRGAERVHRRGFAADVKAGLALQCKNVHRAVCLVLGVGTDIPGHGVVHCPVFLGGARVGGQRGRAAPGQVVLGRAGRGAAQGKAQRVDFGAPGPLQHQGEAFEAAILGLALPIRQRPPLPENVGGVAAVQQRGENRVGVRRPRRTGRNGGQNLVGFLLRVRHAAHGGVAGEVYDLIRHFQLPPAWP